MSTVIKELIKFLQVRDGKPPTRANEYDAGIDFYVPVFTDQFLKDLHSKNPRIYFTEILMDELNQSYFNVPRHGRVLIPSGFKCRMASPGRALIAGNKSGVATKYGLIYGAQVVDYTYKGEMHLSLINTTDDIVRIYEDQKILQFVETPVYHSKVEITDSLEDGLDGGDTENEFYEGLQDDRKDGGFGSTDGKK